MAVSVGEIEATLKLKDQLTQQLNAAVGHIQQASAKVASLGTQFGALGGNMAAAGGQAHMAGSAMAAVANQATAVANAVTKSSNSLLTNSRSFKRFGEDIKVFGSNMTMAFTVPIAAAGGAVFKFSKDFEREMLKVNTVSGVAETQVASWRGEVLKLSKDFAQAPEEMAKSLQFITSTGIRGKEAMEILRESSKAAVVGLGEVGEVASAVRTAIVAYGKENISASKAAAQLFVAVREGGAEADGFARTLGRVIGISQQVGVSFAELVASVATFTRLGVRADEAVTALRGTIATILKPSAGAKEQLQLLGTSAQQLRDKIGKDGLAAAMIDLVRRANGSEEALAAVIPNVRALAGVLGNTVDGGKEYARIVGEVGAATNELNDAAEKAQKTLDFKWNQLINGAKVLAIELGEHLAPHFNTLVESGKRFLEQLAKMVEWFSKLPKPVQDFAVSLAAILAVIGPVAYYIGTVVSAIGGLGSVIGRSLPLLKDFFGAAMGANATTWAGKIGSALAMVVRSIVAIPAAATIAGGALTGGALVVAFAVLKQRADDMVAGFENNMKRLQNMATPEGRRQNAAENLADPKKRAAAIELNKEITLLEERNKIIGKVQQGESFKASDLFGPEMMARIALQKQANQAIEEALPPLESLRKQRQQMEREIQGLSAAEKSEIVLARQRGEEAKLLAQAFHVSEAAINTLVDRTNAAATATNKWAEANRSMTEFLAPVEKIGGDVAEAIKYYLDLGASQESLATWFGVSAGAVRKLQAEFKLSEGAVTSFGNIAEKVAQDLERLAESSMNWNNAAFMKNINAEVDARRSAADIRAKLSMDEYQYQLYLINQEADDRRAALDRTGAGYEQAMEAIKQWTVTKTGEAKQAWDQNLAGMAQSFESWAETIAGWFDEFPQLIKAGFTGGGGVGGAVNAMASSIGGSLGMKAFGNVASRLSNTFAKHFGVGTTEVLGTVIPGVGQALGALAGPMVEKLISVFNKPEWKKLAHDIGRDWGMQISDGLAQKMEEDSKKFGRQAATLLHMDEIFAEAGGINSGNVTKALRMLHDVFSLIAQDQLDLRQGAEILDKNWKDVAAAATDSMGFISGELKEIIALNGVWGTQSKEIAGFLRAQGEAALMAGSQAIKGSLEPQMKGWEELKKKIDEAREKVKEVTKSSGSGSASADANAVKAMSNELAIAKGKVDDARQAYEKLRFSGRATADQLAAALAKVNNAQSAVAALLAKMGGGEGMKAYADALGKVNGELDKLLKEQSAAAAAAKEELEDLGIIAVSTFGAAIATGASFYDALKKAHDGVGDLALAFEYLGIQSDNAAVKALLLQDTLLTRNPQLIQGVSALGDAFAALNNLGLLNTDTFRSMENTAVRMYTRIQGEVAKVGGSTKDALLPMQEFLHKAEKAAKELGIPLDENTQRMIDQSKELGIWKETGKTANEELMDTFKELAKSLQDFVNILRGIPPVINTRVHTDYTGGPPPTGGGPELPQFSGGSGGIRDFGPGTLAMLHGREGVYTDDQIAALRSGRGASRAATIEVTVELDGQKLGRKLLPYIPPSIENYGINR